MNLVKKLLTAVIALVMMLGMGVKAMADGETYEGTITVSKNYEGQTYRLYKLFDAVTADDRADDATDGISYKLMEGKTDFKAAVDDKEIDGSKWFKADVAGNVSLANGVTSIEFNDEFRAWATAYGKKTGDDLTAEADNDPNIKWTGLTSGYYFITTTTGSLVTVNSIEPDVSVEDKNTIPSVDKKITGASSISDEGKKALAQIGTEVEYTATVTVGKGSINLVFHDKMSNGLTFKGNEYVIVTGVGADDYKILETPADDDTLTITFKDGLAEETVITIKYVAIINESAVTKLENDAFLTYGDRNTQTQDSKTETYNAEISVIKYDGDKENGKFLSGAGFKLKNSDGKYYHLEGTVVSWVDEANGDEHVSGNDGKVPAFIGLADGTYTLVESTVPKGYNKAADIKIEVEAGDYTAANLSQTEEIENKTGTELPSTGGMGTTLFYVFGTVLVAAAGILLVSRRRMSE